MPKKTKATKKPTRPPATQREAAHGVRSASVVLPTAEYDELQALADAEYRSVSAQIRLIVSQYFAARRDAQTEAAR